MGVPTVMPRRLRWCWWEPPGSASAGRVPTTSAASCCAGPASWPRRRGPSSTVSVARRGGSSCPRRAWPPWRVGGGQRLAPGGLAGHARQQPSWTRRCSVAGTTSPSAVPTRSAGPSPSEGDRGGTAAVGWVRPPAAVPGPGHRLTGRLRSPRAEMGVWARRRAPLSACDAQPAGSSRPSDSTSQAAYERHRSSA